jgi:hypothetical protein
LKTTAQQALDGTFSAVGVWLMLVLFAAATILVVVGPLWREQMLRAWVRSGATQLRQARADADMQRSYRCAEELAIAARQAAATADRLHAEWTAAGDAADAAWWLFHTADLAAKQALRAAQYETPVDRAGSGNSAHARRRLLHRLATDAHRRGQLSAGQLADIIAGRDGWDADRQPVELDVKLRCAIRDHFWASYQKATTRERAAWRSAEIASRAKVSLAEEARLAASQATRPPAAGPVAEAELSPHLPARSALRQVEALLTH